MVKIVLLMSVLALSIWTDHHEHKIKNKIVIPITLMAFTYHLLFIGLSSFLSSIMACIAFIILLFPLFILRILPAGDIKLLGAIGAIMGLRFTSNAFIYSIFIAGVISLIILIRRQLFLSRFLYLYNYIKRTILLRKIQPYNDFQDNQSKHFIPLSYFFGLGTVINLIAEHLGYFILV